MFPLDTHIRKFFTAASRGRGVGTVVMFVIAISSGAAAAFDEDWTRWGGTNGDFRSDAGNLLDTWPPEGPKLLWKRPLGAGYSSILVKDGRLFTAYSANDEERVVSLDARTGETIWEQRYARKIWEEMRTGFGLGPNATPVIVGDRIVTIGIAGQLRCLDLATGSPLWKRDLAKGFGRRKRVEEYGYSASPPPYRKTVIVQVGGDDHAVIALDPADGSLVWKSPPGGISYGTASIRKLAGRDQFIYFETRCTPMPMARTRTQMAPRGLKPLELAPGRGQPSIHRPPGAI